MDVELLVWEGCPSHAAALALVRDALAASGHDPGALRVRHVETEAQAAAEGFIGSPTIRVDGVDVVDPGDEPTGLSCRVYRLRDGRFSPTPDPEDLCAVLASRH
jgi:hypothetical protein